MSLDTLISLNLLELADAGSPSDHVALVLMGGGARSAYQAGVLRAIARLLAQQPADPGHPFPFRWLFGTSAGAMGAAFLASRAGRGRQALADLAEFWHGLRSDQVYRLSAPGWVRANRLVAGLTLARQVQRHRALLDSLPLVDSLHRAIDLPGMVCLVRRSESNPAFYVGNLIYKEQVLESVGRSAEACRKGPFEPVSEKTNRLIYTSRHGGGWN